MEKKTASSLWKWHKRVEATKLTLIHYFTCLCRSVVDIDANTLASNAPVPEEKIPYPWFSSSTSPYDNLWPKLEAQGS